MLPWRFILSINKFSKYGIVLVAAITLATAVQTQFGQSSTKVYAEETASDANYKDYRMFYVYSADYPDEPNSGGMAGRVIKPSEPYVVDENFRAPGTYSHYDVFDDTGKHYNVGDIITVNDPLVNHKNEEDNRLYYYYYPLNSDNTSEAPANSTTPATSENPISDNDPRLNRMLYINVSSPDDPTLGWLTGEVVTPKGYIVKSAGEVEGFPYFTITGSNGKNYSVGDIITTEEPGLFGHANYEDDALYYRYYRTNPNSVSEAPANNTTPATSEAPAVSTTPATSEAPANSTTPATSETPAVSTTPTTSEAPAVSTTPATGLVPSKNIHSMNSVTSPFTQTRNAGIKSEADGKLTSHDLPKTGDTNSKVGMLGMVLVGLGLTSFVYKGRHRRS